MSISRTISRATAQLASGVNIKKPLDQLSAVLAIKGDMLNARKDAFIKALLSTEGSIAQLLLALDSTDPTVQGKAVNLLALVVHGIRGVLASPEHATRMAAIVRGLDSVDPEMQESTIHILSDLPLYRKASHAAIAAGAIEALVRVIEKPDADLKVRTLAAFALHNYQWNSTNAARRAASAGAVQALAKLSMVPAPIAEYASSRALCSALENTAPEEGIAKVAIAALVRLLAIGSNIPPPYPVSGDDGDGSSPKSAKQLALGALAYVGRGSRRAAELMSSALLSSKQAVQELLCMANGYMLLFLLDEHQRGAIAAQAADMVIQQSPDQLLQLMASLPEDCLFRTSMTMELEEIYLSSAGRLAEMFQEGMDRVRCAVMPRTDAVMSSSSGMCAGCGATEGPGGKALMRCSACSRVEYCSAQCQRAHWKEHKPQCCYG